MSRQLDDNSYSSANAIAVVGLNLALSYEMQPLIDWRKESLI